MIDFLLSTGIRVGELVRLNIDDIDFSERECVVYGKGDKERKVSDGTLWEGQIALYFRWTCLPDCAVPELDADYRRNNRRLS